MSDSGNAPDDVPRYMGMLSLKGNAFLIRGAGEGMGRQSAHALAQAGARLICVDRDPDVAGKIAAEVGGVARVADLTVEYWDRIDRAIPIGRTAIPSDIAAAILFLQSDLARYVTGNILVLDGASVLSPSIPQI